MKGSYFTFCWAKQRERERGNTKLNHQQQQSTYLRNRSSECILHGSWWCGCYWDKRPQAGHRKKKKNIYDLLPFSQFSSQTILLLHFSSSSSLLSRSLSLPRKEAKLAFLEALGKQKSAQERNRRGDDWKHELSLFSALFFLYKYRKFGEFFLPKKKETTKNKFKNKSNIVLYYSRKTPNVFL